MRHCAFCNTEIPKIRLEALPDTTLCVRCAEEEGKKWTTKGIVYSSPSSSGTTKGWGVQVVRVAVEQPKIPARIPDRPIVKGKPVEHDPFDEVPIAPYQPIRVAGDDHLDKTKCFQCNKGHKDLQSYYPFPGVYCPRDKRRAKSGNLILYKLWKKAEWEATRDR